MFKELIEKWSCKHKWKEFHKIRVFYEESDTMPYETKFIMICENCGKINKIVI